MNAASLHPPAQPTPQRQAIPKNPAASAPAGNKMQPPAPGPPRLTRLPLLHLLQQQQQRQAQHSANPDSRDGQVSYNQASASSLSPLPISVGAGDRAASTTRLLLQDTQACVQKFAERMETVGGNVDQSLREIQMCRTAMEGAGEKCINEIADIVYKCQSGLLKKLEAQNELLATYKDAMTRSNGAYDSLVNLFETYTSMYASHSTTLLGLQKTQLDFANALAPLDPLIKGLPPHIETFVTQLGTRLEDSLSRKLEDHARRLDILSEEKMQRQIDLSIKVTQVEAKLDSMLGALHRLEARSTAVRTIIPQTGSPPTPTRSATRRKFGAMISVSNDENNSPSKDPAERENTKRRRIQSVAEHQIPGYNIAPPRNGDTQGSRRSSDDPILNFPSTSSSIPENTQNSLPMRLRDTATATTAKMTSTTTSISSLAARRATIAASAPAIAIAAAATKSRGAIAKGESSKRRKPKHQGNRKELDSLNDTSFAASAAAASRFADDGDNSRATTNIIVALSPMPARLTRASLARLTSTSNGKNSTTFKEPISTKERQKMQDRLQVDRSSTPSLKTSGARRNAQDVKMANKENSKESGACVTLEQQKQVAATSVSRKATAATRRRISEAPAPARALRSPTPSPIPPPPPPVSQTQTQTEQSGQTENYTTVSNATSATVVAAGEMNEVLQSGEAQPTDAASNGASFMLDLDDDGMSQDTSLTELRKDEAGPGFDNISLQRPEQVVIGCEQNSNSKDIKKEEIIARSLFPESFGGAVTKQAVDSYGRPRRIILIDDGDEGEGDIEFDMLDDLLDE